MCHYVSVESKLAESTQALHLKGMNTHTHIKERKGGWWERQRVEIKYCMSETDILQVIVQGGSLCFKEHF